ncbi:hypothetical protein [Nonomuraea cavernae]|uniref:HEAT repeat domain-containing protein n=1 Tax=Nonomuraea cavernae TaxID=2045107 RepID=A0A917ZAV8_9ACTN|nr:hypothetical protein [Nonomuraea cavernae]MCA2189924.1 hypothetical protein [Nonomuraea cavernae]GGO77898.1 hypothetical protein GCM10012289_58640 [Nonomuraea cavernae]
MQTQAGDDLIGTILTHSADDDVLGPAANDLLDEFFTGYSVENLGRLLHSGDDKAVQTGAWLLSELGDLAGPLMAEVPELLAHPLPRVRFYTIDAVLMNGDAQDGPIIAQTLTLTRDPDEAVRWKVLGFLATASTEQLSAGAACLEDVQLKELTEWLVRLETEEFDPRDVLVRLEGNDRVARLFAAAAAAGDADLLAHAATVEDEEVRSFAQGQLEHFQ